MRSKTKLILKYLRGVKMNAVVVRSDHSVVLLQESLYQRLCLFFKHPIYIVSTKLLILSIADNYIDVLGLFISAQSITQVDEFVSLAHFQALTLAHFPAPINDSKYTCQRVILS